MTPYGYSTRPVVILSWYLATCRYSPVPRAAGRCCWLLLLVNAADCCCWLLLLVAVAGCCCWLLLLIARRVFEYFREIGGSRLRQFCRRKKLWIFSGCRWFAAKAISQAKKLLNIFRILMGGRWKRVSPRASRVIDYRKRMKKNCRALGIYTRLVTCWARANRIIWWETESE